MRRRAVMASCAADLKAEGLNGIQIAEVMGVSRSYAYELLNDPTGERARARKRSYDMECVDCGGWVSGCEGHREQPRCNDCAQPLAQARSAATWRAKAAPRREVIERLWNEGKTMKEIAAAIGTTRESLSMTVAKMRVQGWNLPYRRCESDRSRRANRAVAA